MEPAKGAHACHQRAMIPRYMEGIVYHVPVDSFIVDHLDPQCIWSEKGNLAWKQVESMMMASPRDLPFPPLPSAFKPRKTKREKRQCHVTSLHVTSRRLIGRVSGRVPIVE